MRGFLLLTRDARGDSMGLVKTRRLAAMQKQQRAKAGMKTPVKKGARALAPHLYKSGGRPTAGGQRGD